MRGQKQKLAPFLEMNKQEKILIILGPTATGKSDLAVKIAKKYNGEVISADSRQVYKGLDIGTGKITKKEMRGIAHHMLDVVAPQKTYTVAQWQEQTNKIIQQILNRNKLPIICGGTGFYIQSVVDGLILPEVPPNINLRKKLENKNLDELVLLLEKADPERLKTVDVKNKIRLIRAIEIAEALGSVPKIEKKVNSFEILQIGLKINEKTLKEKIAKRVAARLKKGMVSEAENLHKNGLSFKRMQSLGLEYGLLSLLLQNKITKKEFIKKLNSDIWKYAKRQMTWFKRDTKIKWFETKEKIKIEKTINSFLD